jgi:glycosyltransferase involved in cell wall biosynthesis
VKVCFLTTSYPRYPGDASGDFVQELVNALAALGGNEIVVIAPADVTAYHCEKKNNISIHRCRYFWPYRWQRLAYGDGIPWNLKHSIVAWLNIPFLLSAIIFRMMIATRKADIIHANWGILGAAAIALRFLHRRAVVVMIHGTDLSSKNKLITAVTKWAIKHANAVIANSPENYEFVCQLRQDKGNCHYINNGVRYPSDEELAKLRKKYKKQNGIVNIVSAARLIPERRYDIVLRAFAKVHSQKGNIFLTIVGDGPDFEQLKSLAAKLNLSDSIRFTGRMPHGEVFKYMASADIYVSATTVETHGSSVAEAAACGLPIITTRVGFPAQLVIDGQTGFVVEPNNEEELAEAMIKLSEDAELRRKAGEDMRRRVNELGLSWPACAKKTMEVYKSFLKVK